MESLDYKGLFYRGLRQEANEPQRLALRGLQASAASIVCRTVLRHEYDDLKSGYTKACAHCAHCALGAHVLKKMRGV